MVNTFKGLYSPTHECQSLGMRPWKVSSVKLSGQPGMVPAKCCLESRQASNAKARQFFSELMGQDLRDLLSGFSKPNDEVSL